jgi:hypothetical protein
MTYRLGQTQTWDLPILLSKLTEAVSTYPGFDKMKIIIGVMKTPKKDEFYATSVLRYVTDGIGKYKTEGNIYLNVRDITDVGKIIKAVAHEAAHLLEKYEKRHEIEKHIRQKIDEEIK